MRLPNQTYIRACAHQESGSGTPTYDEPLLRALARYALTGVPDIISELMSQEKAVASQMG